MYWTEQCLDKPKVHEQVKHKVHIPSVHNPKWETILSTNYAYDISLIDKPIMKIGKQIYKLERQIDWWRRSMNANNKRDRRPSAIELSWVSVVNFSLCLIRIGTPSLPEKE